jgi:tetratricopeptide (TPR) repeat protein
MRSRQFRFIWLSSLLVAALIFLPRAEGAGFEAKLLEKENEVVAQRPGAGWQSATIGMGLVIRDRVRTGVKSRAVLALTDRTLGRMDERTFAEIGSSSIKIFEGGLYAYSRERSPGMGIDTPSANGIFRGTQVVVRVTAAGKTLLSVLEGEVDLSNAHGRVTLRTGEQGEAEIGKAPRKTAVIAATNLLQWALYYPGVLDPGALGLSKAEEASVAASLAAYRVGDLLGALEKYPKNYRPDSAAARLYQAGVVLAVGRVDEARRELAGVRSDAPGRRALEEMIAAVNFLERDISKTPSTAGEWLARSYYLQSRDEIPGRIAKALDAARRAAALAPDFGYAAVRVAELEFSQGRIEPALKELARNPRPSARNAQAHALRGFLLSAQNRIDAARAEFQTAIDLDGALGNAWLGRGLCDIRQGRDAAGRLDLQTAATVEPNRSILHSYAGKAFGEIGDNKSANKDLAWARELDPNDPTPLLYSAIQRKRENRYNEAVADLEKSVVLNENRRLYRSEFLLDQDLAIRNANLATIYRNNGMIEQSVREAVRAVNNDYSSAPAHLFLANSYDTLRDPARILLRYETAWSNELLLSQLLAPVGGGSLSQFVSQQEYSKLFERDGLGISSLTEYRSSGDILQIASQYGTVGNLSYAFDALYRYGRGTRPNNYLSQYEGYGTFKLQLSPQDSLFFETVFQDQRNGDISQKYDARNINPAELSFSNRERQDPGQILLGWHREWNPANHTLVLLGRLADRQQISIEQNGFTFLTRGLNTIVPPGFPFDDVDSQGHPGDRLFTALKEYLGQGILQVLDARSFDGDLATSFETYTAELQHIAKLGPNTAVIGGRYQEGRFNTKLALSNYNNGSSDEELPLFEASPLRQEVSVRFQRASLYLYDTLQVARWLSLSGGITYDSLHYPDNVLYAPVNSGQRAKQRLSPKAGIIVQPWKGAVIRGACAQALSGASFEESTRLEPTQVAGFLQAARSLAPETLLGTTFGNDYRFYGLSFEQKLPSRTYIGADYNVRFQESKRGVGVFDALSYNGRVRAYLPSSLAENNSYREDILTASVNQLLGERWSVGAAYRYTRSTLRQSYPAYTSALAASTPGDFTALEPTNFETFANKAWRKQEAVLQELSLFALYNHPSGFFGRAEANWYRQQNDDFRIEASPLKTDPVRIADYRFRTVNSGLPGADLWQFNVIGGYRFHRNQCELSCGLLNITNTDYHLNPVNPYVEVPRSRTFVARLKFTF